MDTTVNKVSVTSLTKSEEAIKGNGLLAKLNFRAKGKWINGAHNQVTINDFYCACQAHCRSPPFFYEMDEPPLQLGVRRRIMAPTPLNMLLRL